MRSLRNSETGRFEKGPTCCKKCPHCDQSFVSPAWRNARFCSRECSKAYREPLAERFWRQVEITDTCWLWRGAPHGTGYGVITIDHRACLAHRVAYELLVGVIPSGKELDHLCHNADPDCVGGKTCPHRRCVNAAHLEPVDGSINLKRGKSLWAQNARKTHCASGHEYSAENTYHYKGARSCRACNRERSQRRRERCH